MKITILTLFPEYFSSFLNTSIIKRAIEKHLIEFELINIRDFTLDKYHRVDNPPIGGGAGLIMMCQPILDALSSCKKDNSYVLLTSPKGKTFNQEKALSLSKNEHLIFICGHYEGVDYRVEKYVDELISVGDYILTGGEASLIPIIDSITRLIPKVISEDSLSEETFQNNLLEYPQYTYPYNYNNDCIPDILFSGNHQAIDKWRKKQSLLLTKKLRPDLFNKLELSKQEIKLLNEGTFPKWEKDAIEKGKKFMKKDI